MGVSIPGVTGLLHQPTGQVIDGSLTFDDDRKNYLTRTQSTAGNNKTFTFSTWTKGLGDGTFFCNGEASTGDNGLYIMITSGSLYVGTWTTSWQWYIDTNRIFRDDGWYHIVVSVDTTIASPSSDRVKLYVNGVQETSLDSGSSYPSENYDTLINNTAAHAIGRQGELDSHYIDKKLSQVYWIDGQQLGPEYFGFTDPLTNTWKPKKYSGTFTQSSPNNGTTWSGQVTGSFYASSYDQTEMFDGSLSSVAQSTGATWTTNIPFTTLRIYGQIYGAGTRSISVNGTDVTSQLGSDGDARAWHTITGVSSPLTSIQWDGTSYAGATPDLIGLSAIEIDGEILIDDLNNTGVNSFYLPMDGNSPIGQDKSGIVTPNNGSIWSESLASSSGFRSSEPKTNAFDGNTSSICSAVGSGTITFTSPVTFASNSTIRVFLHGGDHTVTVNGGSDQTISAGSFQTVTYSNSGNSTFVMTFHRGGGADTGVRAIEIDGTILVDGKIGNNFTPVNFGNTNKIDSPDLTGGTPILNTNEAGTVALPGYKTDPNASNLVVALPMVGGEGATSFNDIAYQIKGSGSSKSFTAFTGNSDGGGTTSTRGSVLYGSSFYTTRGATNANAGDYIERTGDGDLSMGTGDYTIEFWFHPYNMETNDVLIDTRHPTTDWPNDDNGIMIYINANGDTAMVSNGVQISGSGVVGKNQDNHFALTREGTTERLFVNGNLIGTATNRTNDYNRDRLHLGSSAPNGEGSSGYYNDLRVYKGVAKYTSPFKVGSPNPTVLPDTPSGVSGSSKLAKITDGAVTFDGSGDYLEISDNSDFEMGAGDFTIEAFFYNQENAVQSMITKYGGSASDSSFWLGTLSSTNPSFYWYSGGSSYNIDGGTGTLPLNKWSHVVAQRTSGDIYLFVDGNVVASATGASGAYSFNDTSEPLVIGSDSYASNEQPFQGFISNVRIVKGTGVYNTTGFTPPAAPLTNVTNTKLLCCQSNSSATASLVAPANEPFSGAGGAQGRGTTSDYLQVSSSGHSDFSLDGDFTVEWWHYRAVTSANNGFMWTIGDSKTSTGIELYWGTSGTQLNLYTNDGSNITSATAATGWHHYAVVRNGTGSANITVYYDGTSVGTISNNTTFSGNVTIGGEFYNSTIYGGMHGPMSQFRLVKGTAVYTSNFTAPTTALTAITNTKILTLQGDTITDASGTNKAIQVFGNVNTDDIAARGNVEGSNFNPFTTDINTVRGQETGYATWNPLSLRLNQGTLEDGNLTLSASGSYYIEAKSNLDASRVDNYSELTITQASGSDSFAFGIAASGDAWIISGVGTYLVYRESGAIIRYPGNTTVATVSSYTAGDVLGMAIDSTNVKFYKNGILQGTYAHGYSKDYFVTALNVPNTASSSMTANFGQKPFKFPPPDGFQPLNGANVLPETVIARPDQYVGIVTYTGNGGTKSINELKFNSNPDLVWIKNRDTTEFHILFDTVRGAYQYFYPSLTNNSNDATSNDRTLTRFDHNGFALKDDSGVGGWLVNKDGDDYVAWCWKAGGNKGIFNKDNVGHASASDVGMNVGGQNSNYYDSSQTWSNFLSSPQGAYNNSPTTNAFNGDLSSKFESGNPVNNHSTIRFEPSTPIRVNKGIRIYAFDYSDGQVSYQYRVNDASSFTTITYSSGGSPYHRWIDLNFVGDLRSFEYRSNTSITYKPSLLAVEIDGRQLLDSGVTPTDNYPTIPATGCSVGTKQGFSITKYTGNDQVGASIPHGLLETPKFVLIKNMTNSYGWATLHTDVGFTGSYISGSPEYYMLYLNGYAGRDNWSQDTIWDPTPSYVRIDASGGANWVNNSNSSYMMYAWHDVPGLQKFGTYVGNENTSGLGPFVELGFRPAIIWIKNIDQGTSAADWVIYDSERNKFNPSGKQLYPNRNIAEADDSNHQFDILSNGFRVRSTSTSDLTNATDTYIYCAWAEAPTFNLYGGQANAR